MTFYQANLAAFVAGNGFLLYRQYKRQGQELVEELKQEAAGVGDGADADDVEQHQLLAEPVESQAAVRQFQLDFFPVYALAMAADWLQGPHIYAIYKYEKNIPEKVVAALYAAGFVSGAISASFAGELADRYGRRLACITYCVTYILTCLTMLTDDLFILFLGRFCGGISTTLLYSVFEAWLITEYNQRGLSRTKLKLGAVFGNMTTISSIVAILSGVVGDILVSLLGGRVWPFMASVACSGMAMWLILGRWKENYGTKQAGPATSSLADVKSGIEMIIRDKRVLSLGLTSTFFEGAMYLFVFFWSAALKSSRTKAGSDEELPFGLIFSSFMCAMMAGSAFFSLYTKSHSKETTSTILMLVVLVVSCCLSAAVLIDNEKLLFWALCMVEASIGAYFPSMSFLKSQVVEDGVRGRVYSLLRLPLNVFVVVAHSLDEEGDGHRNSVFITCAALLMVSFFIVKRNFEPQT
ncbi:major facilitator superfamily domain containing protein 5 [Colletotrichum tofieldiae]|uniref:Molybdate-anion transporter n=1 Tax=Colletotrichum tofieldiae TaxID=708197 RepID=A0A166YRZ4_9PEZI|nr:major facilitator superfamily domain containing protein 5 [Colletotrichum tofieldiae]GKT62710.1 major facilitator superfamily domain containing protein 5 [Colletotrichum tofieldiae]GKT69247.1 major facilitator superfamily domain containing protein 5 [Colletotrichum tofieldiae]GKT96461.1 major facilitator superfamily domain containing protein 5 [Colletotrichum tofieldiae]